MPTEDHHNIFSQEQKMSSVVEDDVNDGAYSAETLQVVNLRKILWDLQLLEYHHI